MFYTKHILPVSELESHWHPQFYLVIHWFINTVTCAASISWFLISLHYWAIKSKGLGLYGLCVSRAQTHPQWMKDHASEPNTFSFTWSKITGCLHLYSALEVCPMSQSLTNVSIKSHKLPAIPTPTVTHVAFWTFQMYMLINKWTVKK